MPESKWLCASYLLAVLALHPLGLRAKGVCVASVMPRSKQLYATYLLAA